MKKLLEMDTYLIVILCINLVTAPGEELLMQFGLFGYSSFKTSMKLIQKLYLCKLSP